MWVAVILMCTDPSALSCKVVAKSEPFYTEQSCLQETRQMATLILQKGALAIPSCFEVGIVS